MEGENWEGDGVSRGTGMGIRCGRGLGVRIEVGVGGGEHLWGWLEAWDGGGSWETTVMALARIPTSRIYKDLRGHLL